MWIECHVKKNKLLFEITERANKKFYCHNSDFLTKRSIVNFLAKFSSFSSSPISPEVTILRSTRWLTFVRFLYSGSKRFTLCNVTML